MTSAEAIYWKTYIDRVVAEKLSMLNSSQQDAVRIRQFADSFMQGINGQQLLPQSVFRQFIDMFAHIPTIQEDIEKMQESLSEDITNINNLEKVYYPSDADEGKNLFYHCYDATWVETFFEDTFDNISEDDIINALYDELFGLTGHVNIVVLDFPHRGIKSCSYILFKLNTGGPIRYGVPQKRIMLLSIDGYYTWTIRVKISTNGRQREVSSSWNSYALKTGGEEQREVIVVDNYDALLALDIDERDTSVIYRTIDNDKLYLWNSEEFVEVAGENIDNTIYVTNLDSLFALGLSSGVYTVAYNYNKSNAYITTIYSLVVNTLKYGTRNIDKFILSHSDGWAVATSISQSWVWHTYSYEGHTHYTKDVIGLAEVIDEVTQGKQDKTDASLQTSDKSVAGAINEVDAKLKNHLDEYNGLSQLVMGLEEQVNNHVATDFPALKDKVNSLASSTLPITISGIHGKHILAFACDVTVVPFSAEVAEDGTIVISSGAEIAEDGTIVLTSGGELYEDGTIIL